MYQWYKDSSLCYAYLSDVQPSPWSPSDDSRFPAHARESWTESQWFSRGWTLQELLAPKSVQFFIVSGSLLGSNLRRPVRFVALPVFLEGFCKEAIFPKQVLHIECLGHKEENNKNRRSSILFTGHVQCPYAIIIRRRHECFLEIARAYYTDFR